MRNRLEQIERTLQGFVESTTRLIPGHQNNLALNLVEAIRESISNASDGEMAMLGGFEISLCPDDMTEWKTNPEWLSGLSQVLTQATQDEGLVFESSLKLTLKEDPNVQPGTAAVKPVPRKTALGSTQVMRPTGQEAPEPADPRPQNAFLILESGQIFPLRLVVVNIGRRLENHLAIDDPRVSRNHAQLRAVRGSYVIFDLNSTGGTFVNGQRISRHNLRPGDVINLAGVPLIYGEEAPAAPQAPGDGTASYPALKPDENAD